LALQPSVAANHAIGSIVLSLFGGIWLAAWCFSYFGANYTLLGLIAVAAIAMSAIASKQFRSHRKEYGEYSKTPSGRRQNIFMGIVNAAQWIAIFAVIAVLKKLQYSSYIVPAVMFVVGIHFILLVFILKYRSYWVTAAALCLLAVVYPLAAESGPENSIGLFGAGIILWATRLSLIGSNAKSSRSSSPQQVDA
jgi:hypothetical protein